MIDAACQRGIEQLRALLSHVDPHLTLGQLVERLVQDGLQRYDPGRPPRGRGGGRREASAGQAPEPHAPHAPEPKAPEPNAPAGSVSGATSPAKRSAQEQPGVLPTPEGTSAGGSTPAPAAEEPARGIGGAGTSAGAALPPRPPGREACGGSTPVRAKPAATAPGTATSAAKAAAGRATPLAARHGTDATADTTGRPEHAHRDGSGGSWSQRSFAGEASRGGAARWPSAAGGSRPVRGQRATAPPGAPIAAHSGSGAARGVAPRRRLLQLRRSAQRAALRVPLPAGARPHRSLCAWRQRRAGELEASLFCPPPFPASADGAPPHWTS